MFATPLEGDVFSRRTAPDVGGDFVADELPGQIEGKQGVHGGVYEALEDSALVDGIKGFLEVNFEDCKGGSPFEVYLNSTLDGVDGFSCLPVAAISALSFGDLLINLGGAL